MKMITAQDIPLLYKSREQDLSYFQFRKQTSQRDNRGAYFRKGKKCVYPNCKEDQLFLTIDHIVPIAVAYELNWTKKEVIAESNLQVLCKKHHEEKDKNVNELRIESYKYASTVN